MSDQLTWLPEDALPRLMTSSLGRGWLSERGSLTERLRQTWGDVSVEVIAEGLAVPMPDEASCLEINGTAPVWLRCVWLQCQGQRRVYARTVIPHWHAQNPWAQVQRLGNQPLGDLLFRTPHLRRSPFEWNTDGFDGHWAALADQTLASPSIARRCVFWRQGAPLLLTEVFLASMLPT